MAMVITDDSPIKTQNRSVVSVTGAQTIMRIRTEEGSDWILIENTNLGILNGVIPVDTILTIKLKLYEVRFDGGTVSFT